MPDQPPERRTAFLTLSAVVSIAYALSRAAEVADDDDRNRLARDLDVVLARVDFDTDYGARSDSTSIGIVLTDTENALIRDAIAKYLPTGWLQTTVSDALARK